MAQPRPGFGLPMRGKSTGSLIQAAKRQAAGRSKSVAVNGFDPDVGSIPARAVKRLMADEAAGPLPRRAPDLDFAFDHDQFVGIAELIVPALLAKARAARHSEYAASKARRKRETSRSQERTVTAVEPGVARTVAPLALQPKPHVGFDLPASSTDPPAPTAMSGMLLPHAGAGAGGNNGKLNQSLSPGSTIVGATNGFTPPALSIDMTPRPMPVSPEGIVAVHPTEMGDDDKQPTSRPLTVNTTSPTKLAEFSATPTNATAVEESPGLTRPPPLELQQGEAGPLERVPTAAVRACIVSEADDAESEEGDGLGGTTSGGSPSTHMHNITTGGDDDDLMSRSAGEEGRDIGETTLPWSRDEDTDLVDAVPGDPASLLPASAFAQSSEGTVRSAEDSFGASLTRPPATVVAASAAAAALAAAQAQQAQQQSQLRPGTTGGGGPATVATADIVQVVAVLLKCVMDAQREAARKSGAAQASAAGMPPLPTAASRRRPLPTAGSMHLLSPAAHAASMMRRTINGDANSSEQHSAVASSDGSPAYGASPHATDRRFSFAGGAAYRRSSAFGGLNFAAAGGGDDEYGMDGATEVVATVGDSRRPSRRMTITLHRGSVLSIRSDETPRAGGAGTPTMHTTDAEVGAPDIDGSFSINQYVMLDVLGAGSQAVVHLAFDSTNSEFRAVKALRRPMAAVRSRNADDNVDGNSAATSNAASPRGHGSSVSAVRLRNQRLQLEREVTIMKRCRHPNIVRLYEVIDDPQQATMYLVMQYVERGPLVAMRPGGDIEAPIEPARLALLAAQLIDGLRYLHKRGILHRDIKPDNILLGPNDQVYLSDFGMSEAFESEPEAPTIGASPTAPSPHGHAGGEQTRGTFAFMAPELLASISAEPTPTAASAAAAVATHLTSFSEPPSATTPFGASLVAVTHQRQKRTRATPAVDVWALGITLYVLLYGKLPWTVGHFARTIDEIIAGVVQIPAPGHGSALRDSQADSSSAPATTPSATVAAPLLNVRPTVAEDVPQQPSTPRAATDNTSPRCRTAPAVCGPREQEEDRPAAKDELAASLHSSDGAATAEYRSPLVAGARTSMSEPASASATAVQPHHSTSSADILLGGSSNHGSPKSPQSAALRLDLAWERFLRGMIVRDPLRRPSIDTVAKMFTEVTAAADAVVRARESEDAENDAGGPITTVVRSSSPSSGPPLTAVLLEAPTFGGGSSGQTSAHSTPGGGIGPSSSMTSSPRLDPRNAGGGHAIATSPMHHPAAQQQQQQQPPTPSPRVVRHAVVPAGRQRSSPVLHAVGSGTSAGTPVQVPQHPPHQNGGFGFGVELPSP